ncbi:hypothetical protein [Paenibacillus tengchongensis]|uniref:hypothetical protein n=1 Tax=Paenibacillus tengchongensis TaxID=2608684 RepID=UPI00124E175C|nr:hypothetical protein [Paenibacillus tengchongensis]
MSGKDKAMIDKKAKPLLQFLLFFSLLMTFSFSVQVLVSTALDKPYWLIALQLSLTLICVVPVVVISLDLAKRDYVTLQGRVKSKVRNVVIVTVDSGKDRKFAFKTELMKDISEDHDVEIQYYRRTKGVISIKSINKNQESVQLGEGINV